MQTQNAGQNSKQTYMRHGYGQSLARKQMQTEVVLTQNVNWQWHNAGAVHNDKRLSIRSIRHWQAYKANIEKRKQIQTQIAVIHNVWEQQADASQVDKHVIRLERVYEPFIYSQKGSIGLYMMVIDVVRIIYIREALKKVVFFLGIFPR